MLLVPVLPLTSCRSGVSCEDISAKPDGLTEGVFVSGEKAYLQSYFDDGTVKSYYRGRIESFDSESVTVACTLVIEQSGNVLNAVYVVHQ